MTKEDYDFQKYYAGLNLHQARVFRLQGHSNSFWLNIAIKATRKCLNWQPPKPQQAFSHRLLRQAKKLVTCLRILGNRRIRMSISHPYQGHYMEAAFVGFVSYASKNLAQQFLNETQITVPEVGGINGAIDEATGRTEDFTQSFIDWCVIQFGTPEQIENETEL